MYAKPIIHIELYFHYQLTVTGIVWQITRTEQEIVTGLQHKFVTMYYTFDFIKKDV
jgi:hypothetical protein